jgi:hypothetical protein
MRALRRTSRTAWRRLPSSAAISAATIPVIPDKHHIISPNSAHRQARRGQLLLAEPGDEDHVDRVDQHLQQVGERQRRRDAQRRGSSPRQVEGTRRT